MMRKKKTIKLISRQDCCIFSLKLRLKQVSLSERAFDGVKTYNRIRNRIFANAEARNSVPTILLWENSIRIEQLNVLNTKQWDTSNEILFISDIILTE